MCAIAGIVDDRINEHKSNKQKIADMLKTLSHRGPDERGCVQLDSGKVVLGHCRLSIIDLTEKARQPMSTENQRYSITYNGEIYNFKEIRKQLQDKGIKFFSKSDTEVVLKAYETYGIDCLKIFNGIFSFAIWDAKEKKLLLARDRYGVKPLYYTSLNHTFLFASEYKAFLTVEEFQSKLNLKAVKEYFTFQNLFSNYTFLENVFLLPAGCYMYIEPGKTTRCNPIRYWDFDFKNTIQNISKEECVEELDRLFNLAVKRQLVSDVEVGSFLSGGIDSGSISAVASNNLTYLKTFTCGFDMHSASGIELSYDEREKAEYMSYLFKTEHYEMVLKSGDMERAISDLVWHIEDPRVGQSYPNYYAYKLASNFVKVVLSGSGGDEIFAGYPWRYYKAMNCRSFEEYVLSYYSYWQRLLNDDEIRHFLNPIFEDIKDYSTFDVFKSVFPYRNSENYSFSNSISDSLYFEAKTFLHGLLVVEDKLSMAFGTECRVPFLDNDLVDFSMKIPIGYKLKILDKNVRWDENQIGKKVDQYYYKNNDGKIIFREVMGKYVPKDISQGGKQGFSAPDASWFRGESIDFVRSIINDSNAPMYQYIDKKECQKHLNDHLSGARNKRLLIWSIVNFNEFVKLFIR